MKQFLFVALLSALATAATAATFTVKSGGENKVTFVSHAPVESFEGKTSKLSGQITIDPANPGDSILVHLEVDLASLSTGVAKRDQHMRDIHLETAKYPKAVFDGASLLGPAGVKLDAGKSIAFDAKGTFSIHGVSRRIEITVTAVLSSKGGAPRITFDTSFPVALPDYNISRPQFLFLKLAEVQDVHVHGVATGS